MRWVVRFLVTLLVLSAPGMSVPPASAGGEAIPALTTAPIPPAEPLDDRFGENTPVMVVLDTSGSMETEVAFRAASGTRLDVAKSAVLGTVDALPDQQIFGLMTYPGGATVDGCEPGQILDELGLLDRAATVRAVRGMTADGGTPTGPALLRAADALQAAGHARATIVLVSDGESNCGPPPCEVVRGLTRDYVVTVNTVGFQSDDVNEEELTCIADATGGLYIRADDQDELIEALRTGTQALLAVSGTADDMAVMAGPGDTRNGAIQVEVRNTGVYDAKDVRLSLRIAAGADQPGAMLVPRPVRFLGNIASGDAVSVSFEPRPTSANSYRWVATASAANAVPHEANGWFEVTDQNTSESLQNLMADVERVAVVGDSYSAGHGAGVYIEEPYPDCARSMSAYGLVLFGSQNVEFIACSGAVTGDFRQSQVNNGGQTVEPQLAVLREAATSSRSPQAVLLTVGGNDAMFAELAASCVVATLCGIREGPGGPDLAREELLWLAFTRGDLIADVLQDVDAAVNDEVALARRNGQVAPILLLSYPRIVPQADVGVDQCMLGFDAEEYELLNEYFDALNAGIAYVATQLRASGRPVYVVREAAESFQPNHTICEGSQSWVVTQAGAVSILNPDAWNLFLGSIVGMSREDGELLHPNSSGHDALARAVVRWSHTAPETASAEPAVWDDSRIQRPATAVQRLLGRISAPGLPDEPGVSFRVRSTGHRPNSAVSVWMESRPVSLGSLRADDSGTLDAWVQIPTSVEAGDHDVRWLGPDADGKLVLHTEELSLAPRGSRLWTLLGLLGGILTLGGVVLLLVGARRPRAA